MSGRWLYLALSVMLILAMPQWQLIFLLILCWHFRYHRLPALSLVLLLLIGIISHQPKVVQLPETKMGVVESIRNGYLIVSFDEVKTIVYTQEIHPKGTKLAVEGEFQLLDHVDSLYAFNFDAWCKARNINASMNAASLTIIQPSLLPQRFFFQRLNQLEPFIRDWCFKVFYGVKEDDAFYLITASALHLSFLMQVLDKLMKNKTISMMFLLSYASLIHLSFAICRLIIFKTVQIVLPQHSRKDQLGVSMLVTLLCFPYAVYELSFVIPVAFALLSIFSCHKLSKLLNSWLVLMPVQLLHFYEFNLISPLFFRFYRFWYSINLICTFVCVLLPMQWLVNFLISVDQLLQKLEFNFLSIWGKPSVFVLSIYLLCVIATISKASLKRSFCLLCGMLLLTFSPYLDPCYSVTYINVGQGDSILITLPFHKGAMMIDAAGSLYTDIAKRKLLPVLKAKGYKVLNRLVLTHEDYDHAGGLQRLSELVSIQEVVRDKKASMTFANLQFHSLLSEINFDNENDNSIVLLTRIGTLDYLFMGDASHVFENQLLLTYPNIRCDVLKVGHHGSNTSSSPLFLQTLSPRIAIVSVGRNNRYGHPHDEVLELLNAYRIKIFRTDLQGDIEIKSFLNFNFIITGSHEFGIID